MRSKLLAAGAALLMAATCLVSPVLAQKPTLKPDGGSTTTAGQPFVTVAITGLDRLLSDINYITTAAETPQSGLILGSMAATFTEGLDRARPAGVVVTMVENVPTPLVILPVTDFNKFLKGLEAFVPPPDVDSDGVMTLSIGPTVVFVKDSNGWAFAARDRAALDSAPADPSTILGPMTKNHDVSVQLNVQAVPPEMRQMLIQQIETGFEQAAAAQGDQAAQELQRQAAKQQIEMLKRMIDQTEKLQFGWVVNPNEKYTGFDFASTAAEGTELAKLQAELQPAPSRFGSFVQPDAAVYMHSSNKFGPLYKKQSLDSMAAVPNQVNGMVKNLVEEGKVSQADADLIEGVVKEILDLSKESIDKGYSDSALLVRTDNGKLGAVMAVSPLNGAKVEALAAKAKAKIEEKSSEVKLLLNTGKYNGVNMHALEADIPEGEEAPRKMFGDKLQVLIGTAPDTVYLAFGPEGKSFMSKAIDAAAKGPQPVKDQVPLRLQVSLLPIMEYVQSIAQNSMVDMLLQKLREYPDLTEISMTMKSINRGSVFSVRIEEGILRMGGAAAQASRQQPQF